MNIPTWLYGKTAIAVYGLIALAVYQATQGDYTTATQTILAALGLLGIRHAQAKTDQVVNQTGAVVAKTDAVIQAAVKQ